MLGTYKFRKDPLYKHEKRTCHIACVNQQYYLDSKGKLGTATSTAIGRGIWVLYEKHHKMLMIMFNTAYGLAKKIRPFTDFPTACCIQEKNGLVGLFDEIYITDKAAKHFTSSIAKTLRQKTAADVHKARFMSVMSDGSTDTTIVEHEVVYVRYVDLGNPVTKLASIQALEHGNAEGVHQCVMKGLATMELTADKLQPADSAFPTLVCANFDGASVMMGSKSGVSTRIQQSFLSTVLPTNWNWVYWMESRQ